MNVKKLLKKQSSAIMPTDRIKRQIKADCGICDEATAPAGGGAAVKARRKFGFSLAACCAAAIVALSCVLIFLKPFAPASVVPDVTDFGTISSATEFYAYSAVSVGNMLDGTEYINVASAFSSVQATVTDAQDTDGEVTEEQKKILDKYALFATGILGEGKITSSCTAADKVGYEFKLGIGYTDVFGSSVETVLYFNKVEGTVKVDKDEEKFAIVGELVKGNLSFPVEGKYKTETDDDETENEIEFTAFTSSDCRSFIKMEYKYEAEEDETESKVVISVYENGKCTEEAKIKGETGEDSSFTVEVMRHDGGEDVEIKFNPYEENGTKIMQVDAWFGENKHELIMQNKSWEQGGGFDFINRSNGNEQGDTEGDKDDKDEPVIPSPEYPDYEWDKDDEQDWEYDYDYPFAPPYGLGL